MKELIQLCCEQNKYTFKKTRVIVVSLIGLSFVIVNLIISHRLVIDLSITDRTTQYMYSVYLPMYTLIIFPIFIYFIYKRFTFYDYLDESIRLRLQTNYTKNIVLIEIIYMIPFLVLYLLGFFLYLPMNLSQIEVITLVFEFSKCGIISMLFIFNNMKFKLEVKNIIIVIMIINFIVSYAVLTYT